MKNMKKLVAIGVVLAVAIALVLSFTLPAAATSVGTGTGVTVNEGSSDPPLIKAKWEQDSSVYPVGHPNEGEPMLEDGDPEHIYYPGAPEGCPSCGGPTACHSQFLPSGQFEVPKMVQYWAIVADPDGYEDIANVYVDIYHPDYGCAPVDGSWKYQLRLIEQPKGLIYVGGEVDGYEDDMGVDKFLKALEANLVVLAPGMTVEEIMYELDKCDAHIYMVEGPLHYHQPCGAYRVKITAIDKTNTWATPLENCMNYICMQAFRVDFTSVSWGNVNLCTTKWIWGDNFIESPAGIADTEVKATVHNIGNMPMQLNIAQSDMGMGITGLDPTTLESSDEAVVADGTTWNVYFDARIGQDPADAMYFDPYDPDDLLPEEGPRFVLLPTKLMPCQPQELDLSIHVIKADPGVPYTGVMTLECVEACWDCGPCPIPDPFCPSPSP